MRRIVLRGWLRPRWPFCRFRRRDSIWQAAERAERHHGVLSWQHRIARVREHCRDLWGREGWRWRVVRTSNAYVFRDPLATAAPHPAGHRGFPSKSENPAGTLNQLRRVLN